jgi:hypothetical protein
MKLHVGERLRATGPVNQPGGYVITGVVGESPWSGLYCAKKVFYNFDFTGKRPRETDDKEWLDVLVRTIQYPVLDDPSYVAGRRELARTEARQILGNRSSNLWPEPIDLLEITNTRDPFTFGHDGKTTLQPVSLDEPIVIFAHPHGRALSEWQESVLPLASLLAVLAEVLEFMRQAHEAGLLLNGLSPSAIIVDRAGRVHYVGTEMVVADPTLAQPASQINWARFFPPERYARGFTAPECFDPKPIPQRRSDLYAWGSLAYFLLTGDKPAQIAQDQDRAWALFGAQHFTKLERSLRGLPPAHVRNWGEQLGVSGSALLEGWPGNMVSIVRMLLHPDLRRRPGSVAELRSWIVLPPPPPVSGVLALRTGPKLAKIHVDLRETSPEMQMIVRRGADSKPMTVTDGDSVYEGLPTTVVEDRLIPTTVWYSVFTSERHGQATTYSVATHAELIEPSPPNLLRLVEQTSAASDGLEPPRVALLFQAFPEEKAAEILLASTWPAVRIWVYKRLGKKQKAPPSPAVEVLLWQGLYDPVPDIRQEAARALLSGPEVTGDDMVRRLIHALGGDDLDNCIQAARSLRQAGLGDDQVRRIVTALEGDRPTTCPVCRMELTGRDRPEHLQDAHGYVSVAGTLLPRAMAVERLWEGIFLQGDIAAHDQLVEIFGNDENAKKNYVASLEEELKRRDGSGEWPVASAEGSGEFPVMVAGSGAFRPAPRFKVENLIACLRKSPQVETFLGNLLRSREGRVRDLAREILLPELVKRLPGKVSPGELRRQLDQVCPDDLLEEKVLLCLRLPKLGVDLAAANACLAQLQEERPVACSECKAQVKLVDLERHLRREHAIFEFRGVRRSYGEMRAFLLEAVCGTSPDYTAWATLEAIAGDRYAAQADGRLVSWIGPKLRSLSPEQRPHGVKALAEVIAVSPFGERFLPILVELQKVAIVQALRRHLALEIATRLPAPVSQTTVETVQPLLADKQVPREARQNAVAALLQTTGKTGPATRALLAAFVANTGKLRSIDKLHLLEQSVGQVPEIDALVARLEDQVRMNCPRCSIQLRRFQMVPHLWDRHRLVLEGRRVRDPWRVMEDWLEDYRLERDGAVLDRCRELALKLDPDHGTRNVQRLLLRHGIEDREALAALLGRARNKRACLCPHCYGLIPVKEPAMPAPLTFTEDGLEGAGYRIELNEHRLFSGLTIDGPKGDIFTGREPGRFMTRNGALALLVGPLMLLAFLMTEVLTHQRLPLYLVIVLAIGVGLFVGGLIYLLWPVGLNRRDRLVDWAWNKLVPLLQEEGLHKGGADFVAGLALASGGLGSAAKRWQPMNAARKALESQAQKDSEQIGHLAALWRLTIQDQAGLGEDPLPLIVEQVSQCFAGKMPLTYAGYLLDGLPEAGSTDWWSKGQWHRLQILLCEQAFAAGLELSDLIDVCRAQRVLGYTLGLEELDNLAQRRLLWSFRTSRPWERFAGAATVFEVAANPRTGGKLLARIPDLLLAVEGNSLFVCGRGLWFEDTWFTAMPATIEVRARKHDYELIIGAHHFTFADSPDPLAARLEKWFRYYFRDFVPQVAAVHSWRSPDVGKKLQARNGITCPDCKKKILTRLGDVGITMDEKVVATWI